MKAFPWLPLQAIIILIKAILSQENHKHCWGKQSESSNGSHLLRNLVQHNVKLRDTMEKSEIDQQKMSLET